MTQVRLINGLYAGHIGTIQGFVSISPYEIHAVVLITNRGYFVPVRLDHMVEHKPVDVSFLDKFNKPLVDEKESNKAPTRKAKGSAAATKRRRAVK